MGGTKKILPELLGPFARIEGKFYQLDSKVVSLLEQVDALNRMTSEEKGSLPTVFGSWAAVDEAASEAEADRDAYLRGERVIMPDKVKVDVHEDVSGYVSIVPTFDGVIQRRCTRRTFGRTTFKTSTTRTRARRARAGRADRGSERGAEGSAPLSAADAQRARPPLQPTARNAARRG